MDPVLKNPVLQDRAEWDIYNPGGAYRVVVTRKLPGDRWLEILKSSRCMVCVFSQERVLDARSLEDAIGSRCDGVIGQLTEDWDEALFCRLERSGCAVYSNYAVGCDNIDIPAATRHGIAVGNTPGVLTETTAETAVSLTLAAARRVCEADRYVRAGMFSGWSPTLLLGSVLNGKTVGVIGFGRIGSAYARTMVCGFLMDLLYYDRKKNGAFETLVTEYGKFLERHKKTRVNAKRARSLLEILKGSDVVSLHVPLGNDTYHMIGKTELETMKEDAILINTSRGPVIDEKALFEHCRSHPSFCAGLDVYEHEPRLFSGLDSLNNVTLLPHLGSASRFAREGMAVLAALNVAGIIQGLPVFSDPENTLPFLGPDPPKAAPSIVNAQNLGLRIYRR
jgi:hydroxypyruvate reductase 1